ncbi:hypothetical protein [Bordetella genomosp. 2]|uniref:Uncharacterized protein n=1 Tax=Bordetella genomosp. 2 TaxID=1983456 RepID=A0A261W0W0_9BORD|nr:hypothetical protein [Bordetella genomosp. 2]OZI79889.1 hypothetical protein CAL24_08225 [Bordetella genomosp. 2]
MDYLSLIGALGGVIAATYGAMTYHRMQAVDRPTAHVRLQSEDSFFLAILEIYPGRLPVRYERISVDGGMLAQVRTEFVKGHATYSPAGDWASEIEVAIDVPSSVAREGPFEQWLALKMEREATISLCSSSRRRANMIKLTVRASSADA